MNQQTRRTLLCSVAGAAALSGCFESSEPEESSGFEDVFVEDDQLIITIPESFDADTISVVDPNGEAFSEKELSPGVTRISLEIGTDYVPGEYRIIATGGDETVAETTTVIEPDLEIVAVGVGANHLDRMPEDLGDTQASECFIETRNSGTGPEYIEQLHIEGGVPNPTTLAENQSGIFDVENGGGEVDVTLLKPNQQKEVFTNSLPFSFEGEGVDCESTQQKKTATIKISTKVGDDLEQDFELTYSASSEYDECDVEFTNGD